MQMVTEFAIERARRGGVFTREQAAVWAGNRGARLDGLLKRAVGRGEIWRIHRGLYCLADRYTHARVDPLELAQRIHGPSYVSLESALSHHGWIPEAVRAITSVTLGRARSFDTPLGRFTYTRVPQRSFLSGVRRLSTEGGGSFFLATPLKAMADYVYAQRLDWRGAAPLRDSLRVEEDSLAELTAEMFDEAMAAYGPGRITRFLVGLRKDLKR